MGGGYEQVLESLRCNNVLLKVTGKEEISPRDTKLSGGSENAIVFLDVRALSK